MKTITRHFAELRDEILTKVENVISYNGNVIKFTDEETKKLKVFTNREIVEIGFMERVSQGVYIKDTDDAITAFAILPIEFQYNILSHICYDFGYDVW